MSSPVLAATPLARNAVTFSFCHGSRSARTAMAILVSKRMVMRSFPSHLDGPADVAQVLAEGKRGLVLPAGQVGAEPHPAAQRRAVADLRGLAALGVAARLGLGAYLPGPLGAQETPPRLAR